MNRSDIDWPTELRTPDSGKQRARRLGVCTSVESRQRKRYGIPRWAPPTASPRAHPSDAFADLFGTMSDRELGERVGEHKKTIQKWRKARGVRAYRWAQLDARRAA